MRNKAFLLLLAISLVACKPKPIDLGANFSSEKFRTDRNACEGAREELHSNLVLVKDSLIGHSENDIFSTLGRYDLQMLDARNQKVFIYFLEKGPQCNGEASNAQSMAVYFNATKLVKEITFQKGIL